MLKRIERRGHHETALRLRSFAGRVFRYGFATLPAERIKMKQPHAVPLSRQVLFLLQDLRSLARDSEFLFPALHTTKRCLSDNTLNVALRRLGFEHDEMTSHGFRAMASTLLNESGLWHPDAIERALAHGEKDRVRAAYHRGAHWALIAVDLTTGRTVRRLARHASTASVDGIVKIVEGRQVMIRRADGVTAAVKGGANGIALSPDGRRLYYAPLIGRHVYAIDTAILLDPQASDAAAAAKVEDLGEKGLTGGLLCDPQGRVLLALQEHNAIGRRNDDGSVEIVASDLRLIWSDTLWIEGGWLYVSAAQVNRRAEFNGGVDRQQPPYAILRTRLPA